VANALSNAENIDMSQIIADPSQHGYFVPFDNRTFVFSYQNDTKTVSNSKIKARKKEYGAVMQSAILNFARDINFKLCRE
jgi:hypothetical protein